MPYCKSCGCDLEPLGMHTALECGDCVSGNIYGDHGIDLGPDDKPEIGECYNYDSWDDYVKMLDRERRNNFGRFGPRE